MKFPINTLKSHFPIFQHRPDLVYLDTASTSQKPRTVIQSMSDFYERDNASPHRGLYELSVQATAHFEAVRTKVSNLITAKNPNRIAFTKGTTESINLVANGFLRGRLRPGDNVVVTTQEHHANFIPWQQVCKACDARFNVIPVEKTGAVSMTTLASALNNRTKMLAITHITNVLGTINPVDEIIALAHKKNIPVLVDLAQSAGTYPINVHAWQADFVAFSAHKMFGPQGVGILYAAPGHEVAPLNFGGGSVRTVTEDETIFLDYPHNLEAGTPHVAGVIGLGTAIDFINGLNQPEVNRYLHEVCCYFHQQLTALPGIRIPGPPVPDSSMVSFEIENIHPHDAASFLGHENICLRAGHHCAQPLLNSLGITATLRASFSVYNTHQDADRTIEALKALKKFWS